MTDQLTDEAVTKLANDCVLAANCMEAEDTFPTGQGILREAARALIDARAERDRLAAELAAALEREAALREEVERLKSTNNRLWQANLRLIDERDRAALGAKP